MSTAHSTGSGKAKGLNERLLVGNWELVGLLDQKQEMWGQKVLGVPVLGDDTIIQKLYDSGIRSAFIGLGTTGDTGPRRRLYEKARRHNLDVVQAIHPQSLVASSVIMGHGVTIMAGAVVNAAATLGDNVIINTGSIVEHDCSLRNHVHIATGAVLAGGVTVGSGALLAAAPRLRKESWWARVQSLALARL